MSGQQIVNEVADDRVWLVPKLGHHATNQGAAPAVPFQVDRSVKIARAVYLRPAMRAAGLFGPGFDKTKFSLQLRISRDLAAQRPASGRDHVDHGLHRSLTLSKSA